MHPQHQQRNRGRRGRRSFRRSGEIEQRASHPRRRRRSRLALLAILRTCERGSPARTSWVGSASWRSSSWRRGRRPLAGRSSCCSAATPASARRGSSASWSGGIGATTARSCLRGDGVEQGDGELPYAPLLGALRPLVREHHPALRRAERGQPRPAGGPPARGSTTGAAWPSGDDAVRPVEAVRGAARAARPAQRVGTARADPRGHALGRSLDAHVRRLPGPQPAAGAGDAAADLPHRRAPPPPRAAAAAERARAARAGAADRAGAV